MTSEHLKKEFFWFFLIIFLTLQIYEAIAAIFWQSASYVFVFESQF